MPSIYTKIQAMLESMQFAEVQAVFAQQSWSAINHKHAVVHLSWDAY